MRIAEENEGIITTRAKYGIFIFAVSAILLSCVEKDDCAEPDVGSCEAQIKDDSGIPDSTSGHDGQTKNDAGILGDAVEVDIPEVTSELLGKLLYFDPNLSNPPGQS